MDFILVSRKNKIQNNLRIFQTTSSSVGYVENNLRKKYEKIKKKLEVFAVRSKVLWNIL